MPPLRRNGTPRLPPSRSAALGPLIVHSLTSGGVKGLKHVEVSDVNLSGSNVPFRRLPRLTPQVGKLLRSGIKPIASNGMAESVLHRHVRTRGIHCQAGRTGTRDCGHPVDAVHLSIMNLENVDAVGTLIGTEEKLPRRMEHDRMWVRR